MSFPSKRYCGLGLPLNQGKKRNERRQQKREKLLQYAERAWGLTDGDEENRIDTAIAKTEEFIEGIGMPTRVKAYDIDSYGIDKVISSLEKHVMTALSESQDVTLDVSKEILQAAL